MYLPVVARQDPQIHTIAMATIESDERLGQKAQDSIGPTNKEENILKNRKWFPLLLTFYIVGIVWHYFLNPTISIFTGDFDHPRRAYVDENSLEPSHFRVGPPYKLMKDSSKANKDSMCEAISNKAVSCRRQFTGDDGSSFMDIVHIRPKSAAVSPLSEAILVVLPSWKNDQFHFLILQLIRRLSVLPWLAKTIMLASAGPTTTLEETVRFFFDDYESSKSSDCWDENFGDTSIAMVRQMIVIDVDNATVAPELQILPQGRRGVLPNMDLVWLVRYVYSVSNMVRQGTRIVMHPYLQRLERNLDQMPSWTHRWLQPFLNLIAFESSLVWGPTPPHALALDHGVDSLTIRAILSQPSDECELVQRFEVILRALSNLHERLHHSTSLYLLPSSNEFIKHEEYLVPTLFLLIPLIIRALTLVLVDMSNFQWSFISNAISALLTGFIIGSLGMSWIESLEKSCSGILFVMCGRVAVLFFAFMPILRLVHYSDVNTDMRKSLQFIACLIAVYTHVPIAFAHSSLAFPSALFWTPLLAFPSIYKTSPSPSHRRVNLLAIISFAALVFIATFPSFTTYLKFVFLPLYLVCTMLWLS